DIGDMKAVTPGLVVQHYDGTFYDRNGVEVRGIFNLDPPQVHIEMRDCVGKSPLAHEFIHFYNWAIEGGSSRNWPLFGRGPSVEAITWTRLDYTFCVDSESQEASH